MVKVKINLPDSIETTLPFKITFTIVDENDNPVEDAEVQAMLYTDDGSVKYVDVTRIVDNVYVVRVEDVDKDCVLRVIVGGKYVGEKSCFIRIKDIEEIIKTIKRHTG